VGPALRQELITRTSAKSRAMACVSLVQAMLSYWRAGPFETQRPEGSLGKPASLHHGINNRTADRQAHPHTVRFRRKQRVEYLIDFLRLDTFSSVRRPVWWRLRDRSRVSAWTPRASFTARPGKTATCFPRWKTVCAARSRGRGWRRHAPIPERISPLPAFVPRKPGIAALVIRRWRNAVATKFAAEPNASHMRWRVSPHPPFGKVEDTAWLRQLVINPGK